MLMLAQNSNLQTLSEQAVICISGFSGDGRYYTRVLHSNFVGRFPFIVLRCSQNAAFEPVACSWDRVNGANDLYSSDNSVTFNPTTNTLTVDNNSSAWAQPLIFVKRGLMY